MPFDEALAERVRRLLQGTPSVREGRMVWRARIPGTRAHVLRNRGRGLGRSHRSRTARCGACSTLCAAHGFYRSPNARLRLRGAPTVSVESGFERLDSSGSSFRLIPASQVSIPIQSCRLHRTEHCVSETPALNSAQSRLSEALSC